MPPKLSGSDEVSKESKDCQREIGRQVKSKETEKEKEKKKDKVIIMIVRISVKRIKRREKKRRANEQSRVKKKGPILVFPTPINHLLLLWRRSLLLLLRILSFSFKSWKLNQFLTTVTNVAVFELFSLSISLKTV